MTWPAELAAVMETAQQVETERHLRRMRAARRMDELNDFAEAVVVQAVLRAFNHPSAAPVPSRSSAPLNAVSTPQQRPAGPPLRTGPHPTARPDWMAQGPPTYGRPGAVMFAGGRKYQADRSGRFIEVPADIPTRRRS